jgi:mRNA interferase MazF
MVDTTTTVPRSRVGEKIGRRDDEDLVRLNQAAMVLLGLAVSPRHGRTRE